ERALLALAVTEGILPGFFNRSLGGANRILAAAVKTLGGLVDLLVLGVRGHTAFDARHDGISLISGMDDGSPRGRGSAKFSDRDRGCDQALGKKNFLILSPSVLNSTRVPRSCLICFLVRLIMPWRLPRWAAITLPVA